MKYGKKLGALSSALSIIVAGAALPIPSSAQVAPAPQSEVISTIPTPKSVLGHDVGEDYYLANYEDSIRYFHALADSSDRIRLFTSGKSTQGRTLEYAVISSPANLAKWEEYRDISYKLGDSRGLTDAEAREMARNGKVIVHIDGGMHSSEVADHQLPLALAYKLLSAKDDPEVDAILDKVVLVLWPTLNPDGQDAIVGWYRKNLGTPYETSPLPWLYQDYVGHDNNRDGYMLNMKESQVVMAEEQSYAPEIWYSQHQSAPFPARIWMPPFADPISSNIAPRMRSWTNLVGANMMARFESEGKPGAIAEARFDNWYPGFLDYTHVFRGSISFFTETALYKYATPHEYTLEDFPKDRRDLRANVWYPSPWKPGWWRLGDAVDYMMTASMSVLDFAAKNGEQLLFNHYQAGRDTIKLYASEGPYAYVMPAEQRDTPEAAKLAEIMIKNGLDVYRTTKKVSMGGTDYAPGAWVIPMDQPYARLAKELFEQQTYPDSILDGSGKPVDLPYDVTGWTLPLQMGVAMNTIEQPLDKAARAGLEKVATATAPVGKVTGSGSVFLLDRKVNNSFLALNTLLAKGATAAFADDGQGDIVVQNIDRTTMEQLAQADGLQVDAVAKAPAGIPLAQARVGLYQPWVASIDEGWTRWILEQYGYAPATLHNADMQAGSLRSKVDVIILPDVSMRVLMEGHKEGDVPEEYAGGIGEEGVEALRRFVSEGGTLVTFNHAASAAVQFLGLPVKDALEGLDSSQFFCSGALLQIELGETARPILGGLPDKPVVMFESGPGFVKAPGFNGTILASYAKDESPWQSGVLLHPEAIQGKAAAVELPYGKGRVFLLGFKPQWRAQSHGAYKFFFNALYRYEPPAIRQQTGGPDKQAKPSD